MSLVKSIRQELQKLCGLLKHGETAAEQVVHERIATLHDNLVVIESKLVSVEIGALKEIRALAGAASPNVLKHIDGAIAATEAHASALQAEEDKANAARQEAAAKAALTPAPAPAAAPVIDVPAAPVVDTPASAPTA
jgi:hypothetical protein